MSDPALPPGGAMLALAGAGQLACLLVVVWGYDAALSCHTDWGALARLGAPLVWLGLLLARWLALALAVHATPSELRLHTAARGGMYDLRGAARVYQAALIATLASVLALGAHDAWALLDDGASTAFCARAHARVRVATALALVGLAILHGLEIRAYNEVKAADRAHIDEHSNSIA